MAFLAIFKKRLRILVRGIECRIEYFFGKTKLENSGEVIISLTSYPIRYPWLHLVIASLFSQTVKPNQIVLYLYKGETPAAKTLKIWQRLIDRGLEIRYVDENYKSYKKLVYAVKDFPKCSIITFDDDVMYPKDIIGTLIQGARTFPGKIVSSRATEIQISAGQFVDYKKWESAQDNKPSFNVFPTGVGGILYPANSLFHDITNDKLFMKLAPSADDIWFKAMGILSGIETVKIAYDVSKIIPISETQVDALLKKNVDMDLNMPQLKAVFDYYNIYNKLENETK